MRTIVLVRHAKSSWKHPDLADFDRPLNGRGKRNAPFMGKKLRERGIVPDLILSSPAKRAGKTARIIAKEIGYPKADIHYHEGFYHDGADFILKTILNLDDGHASVMIFGHNPDLSDVADILLAKNPLYHMPTTGIHAIGCQVEHWKDIRAGCGESVFYDYPKRHPQ